MSFYCRLLPLLSLLVPSKRLLRLSLLTFYFKILYSEFLSSVEFPPLPPLKLTVVSFSGVFLINVRSSLSAAELVLPLLLPDALEYFFTCLTFLILSLFLLLTESELLSSKCLIDLKDYCTSYYFSFLSLFCCIYARKKKEERLPIACFDSLLLSGNLWSKELDEHFLCYFFIFLYSLRGLPRLLSVAVAFV